MWKLLLNDKSSQTGLRSDVKLTCLIIVRWKEGFLFTLLMWEECKCGRTFWLQYNTLGTKIIRDRVARDNRLLGYCFSTVWDSTGNSPFCVYTQYSPVERNYAHVPMINHILIKPHHICEWEIFTRRESHSLSVRDCKSFLSFSQIQSRNCLIADVRGYAAMWIN